MRSMAAEQSSAILILNTISMSDANSCVDKKEERTPASSAAYAFCRFTRTVAMNLPIHNISSLNNNTQVAEISDGLSGKNEPSDTIVHLPVANAEVTLD